jgi:hypothetical protein
MSNGQADDRGASARIGHSLQTTRRWIRELMDFHAVIEDSTFSGCYRANRRISAANRVLLNAWLGMPVEHPTRQTTTSGTPQTLFEGMSPGLYRYYAQRAATFGHTWTN